MKEHPIIFSTEMVRAVLDGRKTQTRRITGLKVINTKPDKWKSLGANWMRRFLFEIPNDDVDKEKRFACSCPYGEVGDRLWVRETWLLNGSANTLRIQYKASDSEYRPDDKKWCGRLVSKHAPEHINEAQNMWDKHNEKIKGFEIPWRSPRFMPKWAARIFLEITNIRVERVQDIDAVEAEAEGMRRPKRLCPDRHDEYILERFQKLWDALNAKRGYGWDKYPWVWVIEFKKLEL